MAVSLLVVTGNPGNQEHPFVDEGGIYLGVSFGPGIYHYQAFACYDLLNNGAQKLSEYGIWTGDK